MSNKRRKKLLVSKRCVASAAMSEETGGATASVYFAEGAVVVVWEWKVRARRREWRENSQFASGKGAAGSCGCR